ncbi:hypothetical protein QFC19_003917 [Naganishia cerealis]|uniref:Uncharacterized protein n=1 Tax=Naganishia cerealis TaxID=610337 RepID=A0ACC2W157_9TREE|nr:hypothetical protein QFC19_003917 [Naganishia cerealis]
MSSRRSERARKRPLSIDIQHAPASLTSTFSVPLTKPAGSGVEEAVIDGSPAATVAAEEPAANNGSLESLEQRNRPAAAAGRTKGGSVRSRASARRRLVAGSVVPEEQQNEVEKIQLHEQDGGEVINHQESLDVGQQGAGDNEENVVELPDESAMEEDEEQEDPVWQEFSQEYYEGMSCIMMGSNKRHFPGISIRAVISSVLRAETAHHVSPTVVEQLPLEIHRNFALLRELDDQTQREPSRSLPDLPRASRRCQSVTHLEPRLPSPVPEELQQPLPVLPSDATASTPLPAEGEGKAQGGKEEMQPPLGNAEAGQTVEAAANAEMAEGLSPLSTDGNGQAAGIQEADQAEREGKPEISKVQLGTRTGEDADSVVAPNQHSSSRDYAEGPQDEADKGIVREETEVAVGEVAVDGHGPATPPATSTVDDSIAKPEVTMSEDSRQPNGITSDTIEAVPPSASVDQQANFDGLNPPPSPANGSQQVQLLKTRQTNMYASNLVPAMASRTLLPAIGKLAREMLRSADEKVGIAMGTYNTVDRHIRSLDAALQAQQAALNLGIRQDTLPSTAIIGTATTTTGDDSQPSGTMLQAGGKADAAAADLVLGVTGSGSANPTTRQGPVVNGQPQQPVRRVGKNWRKGIKGGYGSRPDDVGAPDALHIGLSTTAVHPLVASAAAADNGDAVDRVDMSAKQRGKQKAEPEPIVLGYMAAHNFDLAVDPNEPRYW